MEKYILLTVTNKHNNKEIEYNSFDEAYNEGKKLTDKKNIKTIRIDTWDYLENGEVTRKLKGYHYIK